MVFSRAPTECNLEIDREKVKNVKETVYLGVKLSEDGKMESEVNPFLLGHDTHCTNNMKLHASTLHSTYIHSHTVAYNYV